MFTTHFPEFAFSSGIEEKFLKVTVDLRQGTSDAKIHAAALRWHAMWMGIKLQVECTLGCS